ncbi:hypothetical protein ACSNOI_47220, partial [Actinomadura kijaniata]
SHPARPVVAEHYANRRDQLRDLAARAGAQDPALLADRLMLLLDGLNANGAVLGAAGSAAAAVAFAEDAVRQAVGSPA